MSENSVGGSNRQKNSERSGSSLISPGKSFPEITPIRSKDIDEIVAMSKDYFPGSSEMSAVSLRKVVNELYFNPLHSDPQILPIVSRTAHGVVDGFLGVRTSRFLYKGKVVVVANCHHLMATEAARSRLIPMKMLQHFLNGPQDLSFADGSVDATRWLWKRLGGEISIADSLYYKIPLRPVSFVGRVLLKSARQPARRYLASIASGMDAFGNRIALPLFRRKRPDIRMEELSAGQLLEGLENAARHYSLFPVYDHSKIDYLFDILGSEHRYGSFQKVVLYDVQNEIFGWFLYYSKKGGVCEVMQAVSVPGGESVLYDALVWHAGSKGGIELSGRLMAGQLKSPLTTRAVCLPGRMWTLIHSRDFELKCDILSGRAFLTRLEGDLWLL